MEFLAIVLGIAGLIWGAVLLQRGGLLAGCLAVLLAGACFGVEFFKLALGPIPLTADRLLLLILFGQYLVWRRFGWADPKPLGKPEIVLCALIGAMVLSTFAADFTTPNYQPVAWLIIFYLTPFAVYWIARQAKLSERAVHRLFISLAIFGVYLAATALAEHYELYGAVFPRYIVETAAKAGAEFVGRARGPFLHPIGNGMALAICLAAALVLWPRFNRPGRLGLIFVSLLFAAALYFTLTRSVWIGGAFAAASIVGLSLPARWRMPLLAGGLLLAAAVSATQWERVMAFKRDKNLDAAKTAESAALRPVLARISWKMFLDRPLFGCGYGQYGKEHVNYLADRSTELVLEKGRAYVQHNVAFSLLTETGLLGLGLFLALCGLWGLDAWRLWRSTAAPLEFRRMGLLMLAALGVYFINGAFHDVSIVPMANATLFFLAGVTEGLRSHISARDSRTETVLVRQSEAPTEELAPIAAGEAQPA
ncbi:MAG: O-antigen ligase family protein [Pirellulales bacterium]|nr:O-antigen ligase family protein [Pirellulales bacterium]